MGVKIAHDREGAVGPLCHDQSMIVPGSVDACIAQRRERLDVRLRGILVGMVGIARLDERVK